MTNPIAHRTPVAGSRSRRNKTVSRLCALGASLLALYLPVGELSAQTKAGQQLKDAESRLKKSTTRTDTLSREIQNLNNAIAGLSEKLIATATRIQTREAQATFIEERLVKLNRNESALRGRFESRRTVLAELLAGLQRLEQNPPPALAVRPEDALSALRGAMLLGTVVPEIRNEANTLARNLRKLEGVRKSIAAERKSLAKNLASLEKERGAVRTLLLDKRKTSQITQAEIDAEKIKTEKLAREVTSLKELITRLGPNVAVAAAGPQATLDKSAALRAELRRQAALLKPARLFSRTRGSLNFPAQGIRIAEFGKDDGTGGKSKGLSIATRKNAQVITPIDGHVVYSGSFRSYGQVLIINAGEGYHILLAGMERINVSVGQFVLAGEPVGIMGSKAKGSVTASDTGPEDRPILYVEFRKDGASINPDPWWAGNGQKARG